MAHHHHHHAPTDFGRAFAIGVALNVLYVVIEGGYGFYYGSLALISDAGHTLSDVLGLLLAWAGHTLARFPPTEQRTYGWRGTTILAALFNALLLLAAVGAILWESTQRFFEPAEVPGMPIIVVAGIGVVINTFCALLFVHGRKHDLNIRGAFLHMAADAGVSLGVMLAGVGIMFTGWAWLDPLASILIAVVIFISTWGLLKGSLALAVQAVPAGINALAVRQHLADLPGVTEVHDLHIWAMSTTEVALTAHLVKPDIEDEDTLLCKLARDLHDRFGIEHMTIQIERSPDMIACVQAPEDRL